MRVAVDDGGWVRVLDAPGQIGGVYVRFERSATSDRWRPVEVHVVTDGAEEPVTGRALRQLPLARIEAAVAHPPVRDELARRAARRRLRPGSVNDPGLLAHVMEIAGVDDEDLEQALAFRSVPLVAAESTDAEHEPARLASPPDGRLTDEFLRDVASRYRAAVRDGRHPGPALGDEAAVSVRTAQRWVYLARKRGFLPPGRPGVVG